MSAQWFDTAPAWPILAFLAAGMVAAWRADHRNER